MLCCGRKEGVLEAKKALFAQFECDKLGELKEYVGCKIDHDYDGRSIKITQPVLIQSFEDEFNLPGIAHPTPAQHGDQLCKEDELIDPERHAKYHTGMGKLLHLMKYSRVDALNQIRELSRFTNAPSENHWEAMCRAMDYIVSMKNCGLVLKPDAK